MRAVDGVATRAEGGGTDGERLSVVVPVFNSDSSLDELHRRIDATLSPMNEIGGWELILVNDGSADASWERIVGLSRDHPEVRGVDLTRNWGQHNALLAGVHVATGDLIVTLDDDLQNPPEEIPRLIEALHGRVELVYGRPIAKRQVLPRRIATTIVRRVVHVMTGGGVPADIGGFRAFRASVLAGVDERQGASFAIDIPLTGNASGIAAVSVRHDPRRYGRSNYTFARLTKHALIEFDSLRRRRARPGRRSPTYAVRKTTGARAPETADVAGPGASR
jgi:glycosyltransferase involved in cell wall biosynthesis